MKKVFNGLKKFVIGIVLFIVSIILLGLLMPWGLIEMILTLFWKRYFWKALGALGDIILLFATLVDVFGNVVLQYPMNRILRIDSGYKFGSRFDTISYALGYNLVHGTLSKYGIILCKVLDWFDKDHCIKTYYGRNPIESKRDGFLKD